MKVSFSRQVNNFIDSFRSVEPEVLRCYQHKMPEQIFVGVKKDKKGKFWARILVENDGKKDILFTQADDRERLEENVNDAVATYFDVPYRYAQQLLINKLYYDPTLKSKTKKACEAFKVA